MTLIVDRFEGQTAVLLEGYQTREVPKTALAEGIREGDAVFLDKDGIWRKDIEETESRKAEIAKKMRAVWE